MNGESGNEAERDKSREETESPHNAIESVVDSHDRLPLDVSCSVAVFASEGGDFTEALDRVFDPNEPPAAPDEGSYSIKHPSWFVRSLKSIGFWGTKSLRQAS